MEPLLERAARDSDGPALWFWGEDGSREVVTLGALHRGMCSVAHALGARALAPGDVVVLAAGHSRHVPAVFWGALYAGLVPTIFPYRSPAQSLERHDEAVRDLVVQSGARAVVTTDARAPGLRPLLAPTGCLVTTDEELAATPAREDTPHYTRDAEIAFLQYTSGTVGAKKGVMLSHRAVLHLVGELGRHTRTQPDDVMVNWLPLSHDFGLVCGVLCPILLGARGVLLSPHQWVRRPSLLFEAIARHRGTMCWMPNFALNHCVRVVRPRDLEGVDLGSLRVLMGGAEPVRHDSQQAFAERFAPHGFREESLCAGYGMAETTLAVTVTAVGERNRVDWIDGRALHATEKAVPVVPSKPGAVALVSCGRPLDGVHIRIVAEDGEHLPERAVGEVQVRGESMFSGYHRSPEATAAAIVDGWYATGDVGYWAEGELFVCGRRSDTIIVGGANVYPTDVEAIAIRHAEIKPNAVVAFGVEDQALGTQAVVLVAEARSSHVEHEHLARQLLAEVVAELGVRPADVRIVRRGWVVKTPNGKVSRAKCRDRYLDELDRTRSR